MCINTVPKFTLDVQRKHRWWHHCQKRIWSPDYCAMDQNKSHEMEGPHINESWNIRLRIWLVFTKIFWLKKKIYFNKFVAADDMYFNGTSLLKVDLQREQISSSRESIRFRFKTSVANGVLLYSRGTQGDYIALQLRENRMLLNIDLGIVMFDFFSHK